VSPRTVPESCRDARCDRRFGGSETERRHRVADRCLSDTQLRARQIVKASDGIYRRTLQAHLPGVLATHSDRPQSTEPPVAASPVGEDA
jgi:hypothetical protein